jgi:hypothetical protein
LLQTIGDEYEPRQIDSICELIQKIDELATIFLSCINEETKEGDVKVEPAATGEDQEKPKAMAEEIKKTHKIVQAKLSESSYT